MKRWMRWAVKLGMLALVLGAIAALPEVAEAQRCYSTGYGSSCEAPISSNPEAFMLLWIILAAAGLMSGGVLAWLSWM